MRLLPNVSRVRICLPLLLAAGLAATSVRADESELQLFIVTTPTLGPPAYSADVPPTYNVQTGDSVQLTVFLDSVSGSTDVTDSAVFTAVTTALSVNSTGFVSFLQPTGTATPPIVMVRYGDLLGGVTFHIASP